MPELEVDPELGLLRRLKATTPFIEEMADGCGVAPSVYAGALETMLTKVINDPIDPDVIRAASSCILRTRYYLH